jgi:hypothetical protein
MTRVLRPPALLAALLILPILCARPSRAQSFTGGFSFALPAVDTFSVAYLPSFPKRAIAPDAFVGIDGQGHFSVKGQRIRFFGTNLVADGAMPAKTDAWFIAGRLRKYGYNLVRMHHLDNGWTATGSLFGYEPTTRVFDPANLDRFERIVAELRANGIYANINLHVGRTFRVDDGVPEADSLKDFAKGYTFFDPILIALQKEYARQLLTHVNPYTGLPLANDPVMAMLETTNENSLHLLWRSGVLQPYATGGILPVRHQRLLDSLWGVYLRGRYGNTTALATAWNAGAAAGGQEMVANGSFENLPFPGMWALEVHTPSVASVTRTVNPRYEGALSAAVTVTAASGSANAWHVQWKHTGLSVKKDSSYLVTFAMRADGNRTIDAFVMKDVDPYTSYGSIQCHCDTTWRVFSLTFRAPETSTGNVRLGFSLAGATGTYWFDAVTMRQSPIAGLLAGESLEDTPRRILFSETPGFTDARVADMTGFYVQLQADYYATMRRFLRDTLGVRVPIVGTNWNWGLPDLASGAGDDYVDNHSYWDHPNFPNIPWSSTDWTIANQPMVRATDGGTIGGLFAGDAGVGRPYTISEYNHPFPNRYQSEGALFLSAYGAFHDCDGFMFFDYNGGTHWTDDRIESYFDMHRNTAQMILMPSLARAFRQGLVAPARQTLLLHLTRQDVLLTPRYGLWAWQALSPAPATLPLIHGVRTASFDAAVSDRGSLPDGGSPPYVSDTGELRWDPAGSFTVNAPSFCAVTGFAGSAIDAGALEVLSASDHLTATWVALDTLPLVTSRRSLLTVATRVANSGMIWDGTSTIHNNWGWAPTLTAPVVVSLRLHVQADSLRFMPLTILGGAGSTNRTVLPSAPGVFDVTLDLGLLKSPWFGIDAMGQGEPTEVKGTEAVPLSFGIEQNYPNPFNGTTQIAYTVGASGGPSSHVRLCVYDVLGRLTVVLVDRMVPPGRYVVAFEAGNLASGSYLVRMEIGGGTASLPVRTMLLMR